MTDSRLNHKAWSLLICLYAVMLSGCSPEISPPFLNYQQCKKDIAAEYMREGDPRIKAELNARDYCRELFSKK